MDDLLIAAPDGQDQDPGPAHQFSPAGPDSQQEQLQELVDALTFDRSVGPLLARAAVLVPARFQPALLELHQDPEPRWPLDRAQTTDSRYTHR